MGMTGERRDAKRGGAIGRGLIVAGLAMAVLAGCSESPPQREDDTFANEVVEVLPTPAEPPPVVEKVTPPPKLPEPDANVADALPAEEPPSPDAQMLEDADASGLTSRVTRTEDAADGSGETAAPASDGTP
ncbi:hypothetical protein [Sphingomonas solaris]|uniref:Uncharacterized protein n=1 Tax=Alterirhizorhabdus solaris TaxID=2529389 RepID=A0A558RDF1_9SPHN|nr:hypothetical protein [Sphingomonas solaris]TVV77252.1 hypothetical protein FOY91_01580 [Sphingomonas solaris]